MYSGEKETQSYPYFQHHSDFLSLQQQGPLHLSCSGSAEAFTFPQAFVFRQQIAQYKSCRSGTEDAK